MAGMFVPLVLMPRYTTLAGAAIYTTVGMDVSEYEKAVLSYWRSAGVNLATVPVVLFEESTDQITWTACAGGPYLDPGANAETQYQPVLTKRWFRINVTLATADSAVTLWCIGFLMQRES
jgi:hypothetical protein